MGSGYSRQVEKMRVCPEDYDNNKFKMILELYDKLDENGDNVVDALELQDIADLHVKNRINNLRQSKQKENLEFEKELRLVEFEYDKKRANLEKELIDLKKEKLEKSMEKTTDINEKINMLNTMNCSTRHELFLQKVTGDDNYINFWNFFDYMKQRTNDIKNIDFSAEE
jgi:hypothetical protein|tara:strand:+ start:43 stop:549 length:507 start_codon:yes stop_codon:yes gene_type:complete